MIGLQQHNGLARREPARAPSRLANTRLWDSHFLSPEEKDVLEDVASSPKSVKANVDLIREGGHSNLLFIILEGWACRYATTIDDGRQLSALSLPGDIANLDSLLLDQLACGVRTLTPATVVTLPRDRVLGLAASHPGIARTLTLLALLENAMLGEWALSLGRRSARERLAHLLCELSVRLDPESANESSFAFPLTQEQIADALGLTPVHVNRTVQRFRSEGLVVSVSRNMKLTDVATLRQIGGFDPGYLHTKYAAVIRPVAGACGFASPA